MTKSAKTAPTGKRAVSGTRAAARPLAEPAKAEATRKLEAVMASLAHEIRTPLTGILAISELLASAELGERERAWVEVLRGSAEHMHALASLAIDGVRAQEKGLVLRRDWFDLREIVRAAAASLAARAKVKGLEFTTSIADDLPETMIGDKVRLRAAIENLVDNAVKFTEAGEVRLDAAYDGGHVSFSVADSGIGLTAAQIRRLFRPFAQGHDRIGERFGGAGLGLAFVRRVARAMGGDVTVASKPGQGSVFRLTVAFEPAAAQRPRSSVPRRPPAMARPASPARPGPAAPAPPAQAAKPGRRALRILCAEDNVYGRIITKTILAELGHTAEFVGSGAAVVDAVSRNSYDAVLMDVVLAGVDGIEATRRIRTLPGRAGQTPVIGLSGHAARENEAAARAAGMDGYLHKPVSPRLLYEALEDLARRE